MSGNPSPRIVDLIGSSMEAIVMAIPEVSDADLSPLPDDPTDLLDIVRLTLDPVTGPVVREQLAGAAKRIRVDADRHAKLWFTDKQPGPAASSANSHKEPMSTPT